MLQHEGQSATAGPLFETLRAPHAAVCDENILQAQTGAAQFLLGPKRNINQRPKILPHANRRRGGLFQFV